MKSTFSHCLSPSCVALTLFPPNFDVQIEDWWTLRIITKYWIHCYVAEKLRGNPNVNDPEKYFELFRYLIEVKARSITIALLKHEFIEWIEQYKKEFHASNEEHSCLVNISTQDLTLQQFEQFRKLLNKKGSAYWLSRVWTILEDMRLAPESDTQLFESLTRRMT